MSHIIRHSKRRSVLTVSSNAQHDNIQCNTTAIATANIPEFTFDINVLKVNGVDALGRALCS